MRNGLKEKQQKKANVKCSIFKYEQPTEGSQNVAGINNTMFGDEPLKVMLYQGKMLYQEAPTLEAFSPGESWDIPKKCVGMRVKDKPGGPLAVFLLCFRTWLCLWCNSMDPFPPYLSRPSLLFPEFLTSAQMKAGWKALGVSTSRNGLLVDFKGPDLTAKLQPARPLFSGPVIVDLPLPSW